MSGAAKVSQVEGEPGAPPTRRLLTGAILAGGRSRRLGRDKATFLLAGKPLALWVAEVLRPLVSQLWLITTTPEVHLPLGLPLLTDLVPAQGPLGGLETALFYAATPLVLAAPVDTPLLAPALLTALAGRAPRLSRPALVCGSDRDLQPFPGLYAVRLLPRLRAFLREDRRLRVFVRQIRPQFLPPEEVRRLDPQGLSFLNCNTPEALAQVRAHLGGR
ncbi:MAG: molybdenum cofactor guanylyltransferase [Deltaproteobacteria bacterium]|nr:molybdenum cofactor guanylyltransferase [Deltaproteobacteria bacterium]